MDHLHAKDKNHAATQRPGRPSNCGHFSCRSSEFSTFSCGSPRVRKFHVGLHGCEQCWSDITAWFGRRDGPGRYSCQSCFWCHSPCRRINIDAHPARNSIRWIGTSAAATSSLTSERAQLCSGSVSLELCPLTRLPGVLNRSSRDQASTIRASSIAWRGGKTHCSGPLRTPPMVWSCTTWKRLSPERYKQNALKTAFAQSNERMSRCRIKRRWLGRALATSVSQSMNHAVITTTAR